MPDPTNAPVFETGWLSPTGVQRLRQLFAFLFNLLARIEVQGLENLPAQGGYIVSTNHLSRLDPPLIFASIVGRSVTAFIGDTYRATIFRYVLRMVDVIWVNRGSIGPSTLKVAIQALRRGTVMGIAPEGTRSPTGALIEGKTGAVFLAVAAGVPIVPVGVNNPEKIFPTLLKKFRRQTVTVTFGKPVTFTAGATRRPDTQTLEDYTTELMCRIAALLPPERRGVYASHPRLQELLAQSAVP